MALRKHMAQEFAEGIGRESLPTPHEEHQKHYSNINNSCQKFGRARQLKNALCICPSVTTCPTHILSPPGAEFPLCKAAQLAQVHTWIRASVCCSCSVLPNLTTHTETPPALPEHSLGDKRRWIIIPSSLDRITQGTEEFLPFFQHSWLQMEVYKYK